MRAALKWRKSLRSASDLEYRAAAVPDWSGRILRGYAAKFDEPTVIAGEFQEQIAPGAFADSIRRGDVVALLHHDHGRILGRQSAGTLRLSENALGLLVEIEADQLTSDGVTALSTVSRGDLKSMSFGFRVRAENWENDGPMPLRTLLDIELNEVSIVTWPAYPTTAVWISKRAANQSAALRRIREKAEREQKLRGIR
jgi:HK97 family phage prohead protease